MRTKHVLLTAALTAVVAAVPTTGAHAAVDGTSTAEATSTVLAVDLGSDGTILSVRVLGDDAASTIDGARSSNAALRPLSVASELLAAGIEVPPVSVSSTDGEVSESTQTVSLETLATSGSLEPATLTAAVDQAGARSGITSALVDLGAAGGLLDADSVAAELATDAAGDSSSSMRSVHAGAVTVLNLGALLEGLGIDLEALPLEALYGLLSELGVEVEGIGDAAAVEALITTLDASIDELQAILASGVYEIESTLCQTLDGSVTLDGTLLEGTTCTSTVTATEEQLNVLIDAAQDELSTVLGTVLEALDATALLALEGVTANVAAIATETVAGSSAVVEAVIGSISVGGTTIPGLDATATLDALNQLVEDVTGVIDGALGTISPELAGVIGLDVLDITRSVDEAAGTVTAKAGLTALRATITPPDIAALLADLTAPATETLGVDLPADLVLGTAMETLEAGLGDGTVSALSGRSTVEVVSLANAATFTPGSQQVAPPPGGGGELPRTGGDATLAVMVGVLMAGTAVGLRRLLRTTSTS